MGLDKVEELFLHLGEMVGWALTDGMDRPIIIAIMAGDYESLLREVQTATASERAALRKAFESVLSLTSPLGGEGLASSLHLQGDRYPVRSLRATKCALVLDTCNKNLEPFRDGEDGLLDARRVKEHVATISETSLRDILTAVIDLEVKAQTVSGVAPYIVRAQPVFVLHELLTSNAK